MSSQSIHPLLGMPQGAEWLVILAIVVLVFGAAKIPDLARGMGQGLRIFKAETKGLTDGEKDKDAEATVEPVEAELPPQSMTPPGETYINPERQPDTHNG